MNKFPDPKSFIGRLMLAGFWLLHRLPFILLFLITALLLHGQGRLWMCECGTIKLWVSDTWSSDNSQHLLDPYSFSHLQHGLVFFGLLWFLRDRVSFYWRFFIALLIESAWELFENSAFVINRYREATAALGYSGDTVVNSMGDLLSCALGFVVAQRLGGWKTLALFAAIELTMIFLIRDSLLLNVIMLIHPIEAIKVWQMG